VSFLVICANGLLGLGRGWELLVGTIKVDDARLELIPSLSIDCSEILVDADEIISFSFVIL